VYKIQSFPPLKREANTQLSPQASKGCLVKGFGQDICKLVLGVYMAQLYVTFLIVISQEVEAHIYMLGLGVKHWIFSYAYGTSAVTKQRHMSKLQAKVSQGGYHPKQLGATTSGSNILSLCGGLGYARLLARRPRNQGRSNKLTSPRRGLSI
jgi:hypothetical protein